MFKFSKKVEYALLAIKFLANKEEKYASVKEISDKLNISYELLAKIFQKLTKAEVLLSKQGTKGGYILAEDFEEISVSKIILYLDDDYGITKCSRDDAGCTRSGNCSIKNPISQVQEKIDRIIEETKIKNLI